MPDETPDLVTDTLMERLIAEKTASTELQERKHEDWKDNYELYRNKIKTNRLTQRQAVNIPLMKETIKTLLSKIDDAPNIEWQEQGGDEDKEILFQEMWDANFRENKLELTDVIDKKNVLLYGISTKKLNISNQGIDIDTLDVYDITFDPLMNVGDIESARYVVQQNIFRTIQEILADDRYTTEGKNELKRWLDSTPGLTQSEENKKIFEKKMERLESMGVEHSDFALIAGGDRLVNLTEHYTQVWNSDKKEWERRVVVYADNQVELSNDTLKDLIGVDFWPFTVWVEDPETTDIYSDSVADLVRTPNKVMNVWFSQLVENRTLKNFQMHWFLPNQNYTPQTYTPGPGVMLPAPPGEDINKVIKPVEVSGLDDTMPAIQTLTNIVERGTGATAIEKGESEKGSQTLGEIEILTGKSVERTIGMAKFYKMAWYEIAWKWAKLMHQNKPRVISLYKVGRSGKLYSKKVYASDWASKDGYEPQVISSSEQEQESFKTIQKFTFILQQFPENQALKEIAQKRMLDVLNLSPEELKQVEEAETGQPVQQILGPQGEQSPQQPDNTGLVGDIQNSLAELTA
jgi:hypothetical protein